MAVAERIGIRNGAVGEHNALGAAGSAGGVVDDGQLVHIVRGIGHLILHQTGGMFPGEGFLTVLPGLGHQIVAVPEHRAVLHIDGGPEVGHLHGI